MPAITRIAAVLTTIAMAALGLGVDVRVVARTGPRVTLAVTASLIFLGLMSYGLIRWWGCHRHVGDSQVGDQVLMPGPFDCQFVRATCAPDCISFCASSRKCPLSPPMISN